MNTLTHVRMIRRFPLFVTLIGVLVLLLTIALAASPVLAQHGGGGGGGGGCGMGCGGSSLTTFTTNDFSGSGNCAMCHTGLRDSAGKDVSIDTQWRSTMMAISARDPLWQAKVASEVARSPALQAVIEDKCTRCHMPMARVQAITDGIPVAVLATGFLDPAHPLNAAALDGVSCSLCHQIQNNGLGLPATFTGNYTIGTTTAPPDRIIYSKFSKPMQGPMRMHVGYTPTQGAQTKLSGLCGTCHTLYTPTVDSAGNVIGEFPEQMTFLEWRHSRYGDGIGTDQTCQQCHLPAASGGVKISNRPMRLPARSPFEQHDFVGGNTFMLGVLKSHIADLGLTATATHLDATLARLNDQLHTKTASLAVTNAQVVDGTLTLTLDVQNLAGHKLPCGIPARRVWIFLTVSDASGAILFESGRPLADGSIMGNDADSHPASFEPHYDLIPAEDQVQIYESVMVDSDGQVTNTLLRAANYVKDNRLLPIGFDKGTASGDFAVQGEAAADSNFLGGSDQVTYVVNVQGRAMPLTVSAQLLFQPVSFSFATDLRQDQAALVQRFVGYYEEADKSPSVVASVQQTIP